VIALREVAVVAAVVGALAAAGCKKRRGTLRHRGDASVPITVGAKGGEGLDGTASRS
jgi:hypothetical protein